MNKLTIILTTVCLALMCMQAQAQDTIRLTWKGSTTQKTIIVRATTGTNNITVNWGDGNTQSYNGNGNINRYLSHTYSDTNTYNVIITTVANTVLTYLGCYNLQVRSLDVSQNTALTYLNCNSNQLSVLDVSQNTALEELRCYSNQLSALDVSQNTALTYLNCYDNQLSALNVSQNTVLEELYCYDNLINSLDISNNTALTLLLCYNNRLKTLNLSNSTTLTILYCYDNQLSVLDVSQNTALEELHCYDNQLSSLDASNNTALTQLLCHNNRLKTLNLSNTTALIHLYCYDNQLPLSQLYPIWNDKTINYAKEFRPQTIYDTISINNAIDLSSELSFGNPAAQTQFTVTMDDNSSAAGKYTFANGELIFTELGDYKVVMRNDSVRSGITTAGTALTVTAYYHIQPQPFQIYLTWQGSTTEKTIRVRATAGSNNITVNWGDGSTQSYNGNGNNYLNLSHTYGNTNTYNVIITIAVNTDLTYLSCYNLQVQSLDVSQNTALMDLRCYGNQLNTLDVSQNTALTYLSCFSNQLSTLDVSQNTALTSLNCSNNSLTVLDVSNNTALRYLYCYSNSLTVLDVSNNTALIYVECRNNHLPLSQLYPIWKSNTIIVKYLTPQAIYDTIKVNNAIDLRSELSFGNPAAQTQFTVTMDDNSSAAGKYTFVNGELIFTELGDYKVVMQNDSVRSDIAENITPVTVTAYYHIFPNSIRLSWQGSTTAKTISVQATAGANNITVNWGDGNIQSYNGAGNNNVSLSHTYGDTNIYDVIITTAANTVLTLLDCSNSQALSLDVSNNPALRQLYCGSNRLKTLDISCNPDLMELYCSNNPLSVLDISNNTALRSLECHNNQLPLSQLYPIWNDKTINISKTLTPQTIYDTISVYSMIDLHSELSFGSPTAQTQFTVTMADNSSAAGKYIFINGNLIFTELGDYKVVMQNDSVRSDITTAGTALTVTAYYHIRLNEIRLQWQGSTTEKMITVRAAAGANNITVNWGNGNTQFYNGSGDNDISLSQTYGDTNIYEVVITTSANTALAYLDCSNLQVQSLDISGNPALMELYCSNNQLSILDISNSTALRSLECHNNQLPLSQLYPIWNDKTINNSKTLTPQTIYDTISAYSVIDLRSELSFGSPAAQTQFTITMADNSSAAGKYTFVNGELLFTASGDYKVIMQNDSVRSDTSSAGTTATVTAYYHRAVGTDASLASLTVSEGTLTPAFHADTLSYSVSLCADITSISITGTINQVGADLSGNVSNYPLGENDTAFIITVTAEDMLSQREYVVNIIRNPVYNTSLTETICQGDSILFGGSYLKIADTYYDTLQSINGCDSIIELTLTVNPVYNTSLTESICQGDSILFGGNYLKVADTYYDTLQSINGCDSIIELTLTVNPVFLTPVAEYICQGDTFNFAGKALTMSGVYYDSLQTINGCDSIIELTLTVNPTYETPVSESITQGQSYDFFGITLTTEGEYRHTLYTIHGCDSVIILTLAVNVSINEYALNEIKLYPNPTTGQLTIDNGELTIERVEIYDISGRAVKQYTNEQSIDMSDLSSGIYIIKVQTSQGEIIEKIVKE